MTAGLSKDSQCHVWPYSFLCFQITHIRHKATRSMDCQSGDCRWPANLSQGLCEYVWVNILTLSQPTISHLLLVRVKFKVKVDPMTTPFSDFTFSMARWAPVQPATILLIQPWIWASGTHYSWVDQGSEEYKVCLTLLQMARTGNRTPDLVISSPMPYPLEHVLPQE